MKKTILHRLKGQKPKFLVLLALILPFLALGFQDSEQAFNQYEGEIVDAQSDKPLVFATIMVEGTNISTVTNTEGDFILKVPKDIEDGLVSFSFLGYTTKKLSLSELKPEGNTI